MKGTQPALSEMLATKSRKLAVFTGAGLSGELPAGLPMGNRLRDELLALCHEAAVRVAPGQVHRPLAEIMQNHWKLEVVLGRLCGTIDSRLALGCLAALQTSVPNEAHMLAALHLAHGGYHVTMNLDDGIELAYSLLLGATLLPIDALELFGPALDEWRRLLPESPAPLLTAVESAEFVEWDKVGRPSALIKLHGSVRRTATGLRLIEPIVTDNTEHEQLDRERLAALTCLGQHEAVLVTGYAGEDIDVYAPLLRILETSPFVWAVFSLRPGSPVPGDIGTRSGILRQGSPIGLAASALREHLGLGPSTPAWPAIRLAGPTWEHRLAGWKTDLAASSNDFDLAEAYAWVLADTGRLDEAFGIINEVARRSKRAGPRTLNRLADIQYDRNRPGDKAEARKTWWRVARQAGQSHLRRYALLRIGETFRPDLYATTRTRRAIAALVLATTPLAVLIEERVTGHDDPAARARALSSLAHLALRIGESAPGYEHRAARRILAILCRAAAAMANTAVKHSPDGNRQTFLRQQSIELRALAALADQSSPTTDALDQLAHQRNSYENGNDLRGVANSVAASALVLAANGDWDGARDALRTAANLYAQARPGQSADPSGIDLVQRRLDLLDRLETATSPHR